eukprot:6912054-Prymnesium_polylepis.1
MLDGFDARDKGVFVRRVDGDRNDGADNGESQLKRFLCKWGAGAKNAELAPTSSHAASSVRSRGDTDTVIRGRQTESRPRDDPRAP